MFRRPQHRTVIALLAAFRADMLSRYKMLFGGGTRIVLDLDEFRESHDVDFLCSDPEGFSEIRYAAGTRGVEGLFDTDAAGRFTFPREVRIDQYGIRFPVESGNDRIKVELIREARIVLDPGERPEWSPVDCLSTSDCFAEKLLANSDRWADRQVLSRDLIDLAMLRVRRGPVPGTVWQKVEAAYKSAAREDLRKSLSAFTANVDHQKQCFQGLAIDDPAAVLEGISLLQQDLT